MNLTNEQKRKILNDAPMGAGIAVLSAKDLRVVEYVQEGRGVVSEWDDIVLSLPILQKEVDAEEKAKALFDLRQSFMDTNIDWKDPDECVRDIYRNMIKAGVVIDEKAAK